MSPPPIVLPPRGTRICSDFGGRAMAEGRPETSASDISLCREKRYAIRPLNHRQDQTQDQIQDQTQDHLQGPTMDKLPAQMTVIGISKPGGPEVLLPETRAVPVPGAGEILVKVHAAGVNRPDVSQRSGAYPPP